jgi:proteasome lid subunit RPN8/RPN11
VIRIPQSCLRRIFHIAESAYPRECCGLLVGRPLGAAAVDITGIQPSPNVAPGRRHDRFEVDPKVRFDLMRELADGPDTMVGHYHSHPDHPAQPSARDREMAWEPDLVWLIISVIDGKAADCAAYRIDGESREFVEIAIETPSNPPAAGDC